MTHYPDYASDWEATYYWDDEIQQHLEAHEFAGGAEYAANRNVPTRDDADVLVDTMSELVDACESSTQLTAWVDDDIYLGDTRAVTTQNVTIAGDRGVNGSRGPMLWTDVTGYDTGGVDFPRHFECSGNVRFTGLHVRGPSYDVYTEERDAYPGLVPQWDGRYQNYGAEFADLNADTIEVDNCEFHGWATQVFRVSYGDPEIHHNHAHDNCMTSLGYFLTVYHYGHPHIHHNYFNAHRHCINGFGPEDCEYTVEDNVFGPSAYSHQVDMHRVENNLSGSSDPNDRDYYLRGGGNCIIRRNTFLFTNVLHGPNASNDSDVFDRGRWHWVYSNRGIPAPGTSVEIYDNRIMHHGPQSYNPGDNGSVRSFTEDAFVQDTHDYDSDSNGFVRVNYYNNQYDAVNNEWTTEYGAPVNVEGPTPDPTAELRVYTREPDGTRIPGCTVSVQPSDFNETSLESQLEQSIHTEVNDYRSSQGLSTLNFRDDVASVARDHSYDMFNRDFFDHTNPDGEDPGDRLDNAGISYTGWAENLAYRQEASISEETIDSIATDIVDGWLSSDGHRQNIEGDYDGEGVGVYIHDSTSEIWTTEKFIAN